MIVTGRGQRLSTPRRSRSASFCRSRAPSPPTARTSRTAGPGPEAAGDTVNGRKIETVFADPNVALSDARDLAERDGMVMLEGPIPANAIGAVASCAGPHDIPVDDISLYSDAQIKSYKQFRNAYASDWNCDRPR